ncbi:hypothetical protein L7F22_022477 [Adiantum nelumboides]|nr:hypothetical protein [Adiantum nelumboides]
MSFNHPFSFRPPSRSSPIRLATPSSHPQHHTVQRHSNVFHQVHHPILPVDLNLYSQSQEEGATIEVLLPAIEAHTLPQSDHPPSLGCNANGSLYGGTTFPRYPLPGYVTRKSSIPPVALIGGHHPSVASATFIVGDDTSGDDYVPSTQFLEEDLFSTATEEIQSHSASSKKGCKGTRKGFDTQTSMKTKKSSSGLPCRGSTGSLVVGDPSSNSTTFDKTPSNGGVGKKTRKRTHNFDVGLAEATKDLMHGWELAEEGKKQRHEKSLEVQHSQHEELANLEQQELEMSLLFANGIQGMAAAMKMMADKL